MGRDGPKDLSTGLCQEHCDAQEDGLGRGWKTEQSLETDARILEPEGWTLERGGGKTALICFLETAGSLPFLLVPPESLWEDLRSSSLG